MKKIAVLLVAGLLVFALVTDPAGLASGVQTVASWLKDGAVAVITFVKGLFQ